MKLSADFHVHSNYSDGRPIPRMVEAARAAGLETIGFTDHCTVSDRPEPRRAATEFGHILDSTHERRTAAIESVRERTELAVRDAVELDYHPADEDEIDAFLAETDFDYAVGSVHELDGACIFDDAHFSALPKETRRDLVDEYYDRVERLIRWDRFDVVGHVDAIERTPPLRGYSTTAHYEAVADALAESATLPELNAGRVRREYGEFHPAPSFLDAIRARNVPIVPGTDAHRPDEIADRARALAERIEALGLETAEPGP